MGAPAPAHRADRLARRLGNTRVQHHVPQTGPVDAAEDGRSSVLAHRVVVHRTGVLLEDGEGVRRDDGSVRRRARGHGPAIARGERHEQKGHREGHDRGAHLTALGVRVSKAPRGRLARRQRRTGDRRRRGPRDARARRGHHSRHEHHPRGGRHHGARGGGPGGPALAEARLRVDCGSPRARRRRPAPHRPSLPRPVLGTPAAAPRPVGARSAVPHAAYAHLQRLQDRPLRRAARPAGDGRTVQAAAPGDRAALGAAGPRRRVLDRRRRGVRRGGRGHRGGWGGGGSRARRARARGGLRRGRPALPPAQLRRQHGAGLRALLPAGVRPGERQLPDLRGQDGGRLDGGERRDRLPDPELGARPLVRGDRAATRCRPSRMEPYFDQVETHLGVAPVVAAARRAPSPR